LYVDDQPVHMILKIGLSLVSTVMRRLLTGYELKKFRDNSIRFKGDERILGSSDFVKAVLNLKQIQKEFLGG